MTALTPNSRIILAINHHIESGTPIDAHNLTPDEIARVKAVFHLFKAWKKNPLLDKRVFLEHVHHRRKTDLANDLYCFEHIKNMAAGMMLMSKDDLLIIQQQAVLEGYKAARQNGESATLLKAADKIEKLRNSMPEMQEDTRREMEDFYTEDITHIAPNFKKVDSKLRKKYLEKYGGKQDVNAQQVEDKMAALLEQSKDDDMPSIL